MKRRGTHTPQREQAAQEQIQAEQIRATVERVEHFNYLKAKFGSKT
jgi:hypothetical protein